jgi:membrane protein DedA with SNARE-associated domain
MQLGLNFLNRYIELIEVLIQRQSVLAPLLLLLIEEAGVPILIPGDGILAYTGYNIQTAHQSSLWVAFGVAMLAVAVGSSILFFLSRRYGQQFIQKLGKFIFLKDRHLDHAERWFKKYGFWTIVIGRHIPGMRIPITIFAAISGVRYRTFILSTLASMILWIWFYLSIGHRYGSSLQQLLSQSTGITIGVLVGLFSLVIGLHVYGAYRQKHGK